MKKSAFILAVIFMVSGAAVTLAFAKSSAIKVAYVDVKKVFSQYSGTKDAQKIMETEVKKKEEEIRLREDEIKKLKQELKEKKLLMTDDVKKKKQDDIDRKTEDLAERTAMLRQDLAGRETKLIEEIVARISRIAKDIAESKGYDLVIEKNAVYYGADDLTADIVKGLETKDKQ